MKNSPYFILCLNLLFCLSAFVVNANAQPAGSVSITGTHEVGQVLSAEHNLTDPNGMGTVTYQWYRDGVPIMHGLLKNGVNGVDGLNGARGVALSADGNHAYVTGQSDDAVSWYERNASTGALTYEGMLKDGVGGVDGLDYAQMVTALR